jgi:hypothetical protein
LMSITGREIVRPGYFTEPMTMKNGPAGSSGSEGHVSRNVG